MALLKPFAKPYPFFKTYVAFVTSYHDQYHAIGIDTIGFKSAFSQYCVYKTIAATATTSNITMRRTFIKKYNIYSYKKAVDLQSKGKAFS